MSNDEVTKKYASESINYFRYARLLDSRLHGMLAIIHNQELCVTLIGMLSSRQEEALEVYGLRGMEEGVKRQYLELGKELSRKLFPTSVGENLPTIASAAPGTASLARQILKAFGNDE